MEKINLNDKFKLITDYWSPACIGELNGQAVKIAKFKGTFPMHHHENEDELFFVIKGQCFLELENKTIELNEGEMYIVPKGIDHRPYAKEEAHVVMFEPNDTLNTGNLDNEYTQKDVKKI
ncbi:MAG: cupin domain-containing protein [Cyclobacteriaceae bacterium]|nr:cupin domain-containing protein [Cyclobacteriaceae bacterium]